MIRRVFVHLFRRAVVAMVVLCLGCAAQSNPVELNQRIERQVRATFSLPPTVNVQVGPRTTDPDFPGYDKVVVTLSQGDRKLPQEFLLSKDGKTLVRATKMDLSKDPYAEIMKKIDVTGRPVKGNKDAKVTIVNFDDFECPFCSRMHQTLMHDVMNTYGERVKIIYKDYPLTEIHPWAVHAAIDANCLAQQSADAYWDFADVAHASQKQITAMPDQGKELDRITTEIAQKRNLQMTPLLSCLKAQSDEKVKASMLEGNALGVSATPTMFINGEKLDGAMPAQDVHAAIDRALRESGAATPVAASKQ